MLTKYPRNEKGRDFVVGDIHGCFFLLQAELDKLEFNEETDRLFSVGDLVDRGKQSEDSASWLVMPWFHAVRGNHEQMCIDMYDGVFPEYVCLANGGGWFCTSPVGIQGVYAELFRAMPLAIEVDTPEGRVGIVHAEVPYGDWDRLDTPDATFKNTLLWAREKVHAGNGEVVANIDKVYVGHTPLKRPVVLGNVHYIDTGAVFGDGYMTIERIN